MAQVTDTSVSPLSALARRWKLAALLIVVGAGAGVGSAYLTPTTYTGEARVAVGSQSLDARIVAGYTTASQQLASDISRYVNDRQAQNDLAPVLGDRADSVDRISASPIAGSSVVMVEVDAQDRAAATQAAEAVAQQLVDQVNATYTNPDEILQRYTDISGQVQATQQAVVAAQSAIGAAQAGRGNTEALAAAQATLQQQSTQLDVLKVQQEALASQYRNATTQTSAVGGLSIVRQAQISRTDFSSTVQRNGLAGAGLGGVVALVLATFLERRKPRSQRGAGEDTSIDLDRDEDADDAQQRAGLSNSPHRV